MKGAYANYIFNVWNGLSIIKHRNIEEFRSILEDCLQVYTASEICQAMRNYKDALSSEKYSLSSSWTLKEFLYNEEGIPNFLNREKMFEKYEVLPDDTNVDDFSFQKH